MDTSLLKKLENLGYYTLPPRHEHCVGHTGLFMLIRREAVGDEVDFDPKTFHLRLLDWDGKAHWTTFKVTTPFPMSRVVCPGPLTIQDRAGKRATFFVFGGSLEAHDETPNERVYSLRSSAPVLELTAVGSTPANLLATETEVLWAELQADWGIDDEAFGRQLTRTDPFHLFVATLQAILDRYEHLSDSHTLQQQQTLYHALQHEKTWLQQTSQWPDPVPTLAALRKQ